MNNIISITVDGKLIDCQPNDTYFEAISLANIDIPTLCHESELKPTGACRICVVEVEGAPNLVPSCSTPVRADAIVKTNSNRVKKARQVLVELLLASHPLKCIVCEKNGVCTLQQLAYEYVPAERIERFKGKLPETDLSEENEFFFLDYNACIRCTKCVRVVDEIQLCGVLTLEQRGFEIYPSPGFGRSFKDAGCVACGNCVAVCPVSALVPNSVLGAGRIWDFTKTITTCTYCGVGCQLELITDKSKNKVIYVDSYRKAVVNGLSLCVKGRYGWDFIHNPDRINTPLIRTNGGFEPISWEEALNKIEVKFKQIRKESGSDALAFLSSAKCTNEENYLMQKLARAGIGTNNVDHCARLCHASTVAGLARAFGSGAMTNSIDDITKLADVTFIIGSNTTEAHPVIGIKLKQAIASGKMKLIVADPREIEITDDASIYLQQRPGSDVALINAMLKIIIDEKLYNDEFIQNRTENFNELKLNLDQYLLEDLCKITGIPLEKIKKATYIYAKAKSASIVYAMGITQHITGTDNVLSLANLAMITGNIGRPGTGVNPLRGQNNVQGACDLGALPNVYTGYQRVDDLNNQKKFREAWNVPHLSDKPGLTVVEIMDKAYDREIRGLFIMGENPVLSDPNVNHVRDALDKVEFLVVQDLYITETAKYANIILPGVSFAEKNGTYTNTERRIQLIRKSLKLEKNRLPDWKILQLLLNRFDIKTQYDSPKEIMDEIAQVTPIYGGINYDRIEDVGLQWPCKDKTDPGTTILHQGTFTRGKGKFHAVKYLDPAEMPNEEFPFILTTGRNLYHWHTGEMTHRSEGLHKRSPVEKSEINNEDATELGITNGDKIIIKSRRGQLITIAKVTNRIQKGVIFMTFHYKESAANLLTNDALDPIAKIPEFKVCAVNVNNVNKNL
ncbi:MAG: formate dehydrogenase subunit alpha [Candidatus Hodarchaeales archaeon]|jgi:formate dehydrogenase alpha subunit